MRKLVASTCALLMAPGVASAACPGVAPSYAASAGGFGVLGGQIYAPDGTLFQARGVDVMDGGNMPSAATLQAQFPGVNFVRLAIYNYDSPSSLSAYVSDLTSHGIVVELENHRTSSGQNAGGGDQNGNVPFTGQMLAQEQAWYSSIASAFKNNPYVWFGTNNEPAGTAAQISAWQTTTYDTIRQAGNNNPIMLEAIGPGAVQSDYAGMTNTVWDMHYYGWQSGYSTNPSTVSQNLTQSAAAVQATQSADGTMPLIIGEYGNSTSGTSPDANGTQVIQAVQASGFGAVAWAYMSGANDALLNGNGLSAFGQAVASFTAQSGSSGCPISPVVMQPTLSDSAVANATDAANTDASTAAAASSLTIDQIAALAAQGASDTSTATPVLAVAAPTGTMPAPAAVSGTTSFAVSDTYQTVTPGVGNATGTISGSGNTVAATGGIQTLTVTGAGNTITTGPYNDTITVSSAGNTIDAGGGNDTLILTYGGGSGVPVNADPAAVAPLGAVGNTFLAPAPGTGTLTIQGALAGNDRIDLTRALAGTTWNHNPATLWNYVIASATATGCTISVDGQVIVSIPGGAPAGQLGSYVTAQ